MRRGWGNCGNVSTFSSIVHHGVLETKWLRFGVEALFVCAGPDAWRCQMSPQETIVTGDAEAAEALEAARSMAPGQTKSKL